MSRPCLKQRCKHHWRQYSARVAIAFTMPRHVSRRQCYRCKQIQEFADNYKHPRWVTIKQGCPLPESPSKPKRSRNTKHWVHVWWSASEIVSVRFVRWVRMRRGSGDDDTNKIQVGALVWSDWLFSPPLMKTRRARGGMPRGHFRIRPYHTLYPTYQDARMLRNAIVKPSLNRVRKNRP